MKHIKHTKHIQQCQCSTAPTIFIEKTAHFRRLKKTGYHPTIGPTDHRTNRPTDTTSYRDARTHLKTGDMLKKHCRVFYGLDPGLDPDKPIDRRTLRRAPQHEVGKRRVVQRVSILLFLGLSPRIPEWQRDFSASESKKAKDESIFSRAF